MITVFYMYQSGYIKTYAEKVYCCGVHHEATRPLLAHLL
jgi:hypothetical protein